MAQPVWTLSVDLQTKTATFTSGLADAAKGARGSFNDIKSDAQKMGREVSGSMTESRHGVMLLGEEFGIHLPRALTSFIASIGPVGAAMEAAFPFLAIIVGATLLLEHLSKVREEGEKLTASQVNFGTATFNVLNAVNDKLLQAGIRTDELNHNHLGALEKQLALIDHASMAELVQSFGVVSKAADATFEQLKTSWYQWGVGSAGAKSALEHFRDEYSALLAQGKDKEANDLLAGTRQSAEKVLALQKQASDNQFKTGVKGQHVDSSKFEQAKIDLQKMGIGFTQKELESQESLVGALQAQANVQEKVNELKAAQKANAVTSTGKSMDADADKIAREQAAEAQKALDEAEKMREEAYRLAVAQIQQNEREKIDATAAGSRARLSAIDSAIKEENAKGLQETAFYRSLLSERINVARQMDEEGKKLRAEAGREAAEHEARMGELVNAAKHQQAELRMSFMRNSEQAQLAEEMRLADEEFRIKTTANAQELAALDKSDKEYENKVVALNHRLEELTKQHEDRLTAIKSKAEEDRNKRVLAADGKFQDSLATGLTSTLMRHESFAKMMVGLGDQVASGMIQNALKSILAADMTKEHDAAAAARKAFLAGEQTIPGIPGVILGGALGAMAFAQVMAFQEGGIVPGVGKGDKVPAMLEPGEGVLNNKQMEARNHRAKFGGDEGGGNHTHVHIHSSPTIHALDAEGMGRVLDKHTETLTRHFNNHIRKMNR